MPIRKPKNYNRVILINTGTDETPKWGVVAVGILSQSGSISENTESYYYMDGRGTAEKETVSQEVSRAFTGHRAVGDAVQDFILDEVLYDLDRREVVFMDYDDGTKSSDSTWDGWRGKASLQITDMGSGDAQSRQNIGFTLNYKGKPERGTIKYDSDTQAYSFTPKL